ncbi:MAG: Rrf2 family transcriptional regulator [Phenylobacterium sp.]|uniref:RrF2 family transcriptional regulator n=1 Tax=Phenylobacterium sp. TaxID=1871053 RepID=UPI002734BAB6|nr:Rrf2 family transcriptional regulator [Phenylobacterium sp.]MDP3749930.1 Rrf2 family transcriptional regulator [Phenylobacterium sp.]
MRRLGEGVEHALHCVMVLGALPESAVIPAKALAEFHGVSESYLLKHLKALSAAGVVVSTTGKKGGYRLARPAAETTFLDVVEAVDGPGPAFQCTEIRQRGPATVKDPCAYKAPCLVHRRMLQAERAWRDALRSQTVAGLIAGFNDEMDPRNLIAGTEWLKPKIRNSRPS